MSEAISQTYEITDRACRMLEAKANGFTHREIAGMYDFAHVTVKKTFGEMYESLGVVGTSDPGALAITAMFYGGLFRPGEDLQNPGEPFVNTMLNRAACIAVTDRFYSPLAQPKEVPGKPWNPAEVRLTLSQRKSLLAAMLGYGEADARRVIGIAPDTFAAHMWAARSRLGARNKYQAVARRLLMCQQANQTLVPGLEPPIDSFKDLLAINRID